MPYPCLQRSRCAVSIEVEGPHRSSEEWTDAIQQSMVLGLLIVGDNAASPRAEDGRRHSTTSAIDRTALTMHRKL